MKQSYSTRPLQNARPRCDSNNKLIRRDCTPRACGEDEAREQRSIRSRRSKSALRDAAASEMRETLAVIQKEAQSEQPLVKKREVVTSAHLAHVDSAKCEQNSADSRGGPGWVRNTLFSGATARQIQRDNSDVCCTDGISHRTRDTQACPSVSRKREESARNKDD